MPTLVSDQVFRTVLEAVLAGRYAPGEKLPTQRALAADLGVTMGSLREAVKRLEQMGLVEARQGDAAAAREAVAELAQRQRERVQAALAA